MEANNVVVEETMEMIAETAAKTGLGKNLKTGLVVGTVIVVGTIVTKKIIVPKLKKVRGKIKNKKAGKFEQEPIVTIYEDDCEDMWLDDNE